MGLCVSGFRFRARCKGFGERENGNSRRGELVAALGLDHAPFLLELFQGRIRAAWVADFSCRWVPPNSLKYQCLSRRTIVGSQCTTPPFSRVKGDSWGSTGQYSPTLDNTRQHANKRDRNRQDGIDQLC